MKLFFGIVFIVISFAYNGLMDIVPSSADAISLVIGVDNNRMEIDFGLYQLLVIYHAARDLNREKTDIIVWLSIFNSTATAEEILRENVSVELNEFLKTLPGLFFVDGHYFCSEYGENFLANDPYRVMRQLVMIKFKAWQLAMYKRVLQWDHDQLPIDPSGFDRVFGMSHKQDMWERNLIRTQDLVGRPARAPINGANWLLKPNLTTYKTMCIIAKNNSEKIMNMEGKWGNYETFQSPFCDQDQFHNLRRRQPGDWLTRSFPFTKEADPNAHWDFHAASVDQGLIWFYFVVNEKTRGKVLLISKHANKSLSYNPKGNPTCRSYPYINIFSSWKHFGGRNKIAQISLSKEWVHRAMRMAKAYEISRFDKLQGYHEKWIEVAKNTCCNERKTILDNKCIHIFKFC